jgi:parallel beta-helix repeat protein
MNRFAVLALSLALLAAVQVAEGKDLYVDSASGSDTTSYSANSAANPWRTIGRAAWGSASRSNSNPAEAARAGDVVLVSGGPFTTEATNTRYVPALNPVNSGSPGNPIVFRAVGWVELRQANGDGPVMGSYRVNYVEWHGFAIDERHLTVHPDTGPVVVWDATGVVIDGCDIAGITQTYGDNHNGIRLEQARDTVVRNCRISGILGSGTSDHNNAGIMLYGSRDVVIENNEIDDCGAGIFPKGADNLNITIRRNRVSNCSKGIRISYSAPSSGQNTIYQNIIENASSSYGQGINIAENSYNWIITNNTIVDVPYAFHMRVGPITNVEFTNNIVAVAEYAVDAGEFMEPVPTGGRNLYFDSGAWSSRGRAYSSFSSWIAAVPADATSATDNPRFVNMSGRDYRLAAGSPALTLGRDVLDLNLSGGNGDVVPAGAYVTGDEIIGRDVGIRPSAPTDFRVE